ncbi:MAG: hypothetical protein IPJ81_04235 [Chitinophagaceae bacterium]|nr:hypothetical protein [Chitinophagaceae bacterium]
MKKVSFLLLIVAIGIFAACKKSETFSTGSISDYAPYKVGKYITYQLDSLKFINFGTKDTVVTYQVKYLVDAEISDNLGRPAYRVLRFIRKTSLDPWVPDNTFMAISEDNTLEFVENNLRFIKLKLPIYNGYSWKGNSYIDDDSQDSELKYLDNWDYIYDSVNVPITVGNFNIDSTLKVNQRDEISGSPGNPNAFSERNISEEKYAKGIGLVYRRFLHSEYQPPIQNEPGRYADGSYGITLTMIDHN